jgi:XapX domain-containing protein
MRPYVASLVIGVVVGFFYAVVNVRSPAPPIIALLGLLGIVIGESSYPLIKSKLALGAPPPRTVTVQTQVKRACAWTGSDPRKQEAAK